MNFSNTCIIILGVILLFHLCTCTHSPEGFRSGAQIQLMTSRPYYGWYDYHQRWRNVYPRRRRFEWGWNRWPWRGSQWW